MRLLVRALQLRNDLLFCPCAFHLRFTFRTRVRIPPFVYFRAFRTLVHRGLRLVRNLSIVARSGVRMIQKNYLAVPSWGG